MNTRSLAAVAVIAALGLALAGCAARLTRRPRDGTLSVVASTNVYGDIASTIGGDLVEVTSIIDSPDKDPHEYEATARDQLAISEADLIIENGGGYDPFVDTLLDASGNTDAIVLNAVEISGLVSGDGDHVEDDHAQEEHAEEDSHAEGEGHDHIEGFNEHVWYNFHAMEAVAAELAHELGELDPDNAATYEQNAASFTEQIEGLEAQAQELAEAHSGDGVAITEPVALYLLEEVGLQNLTPDAFSEAVEEDTDVPADALSETLALFSSKSVVLLAYNEQTTGPQTEAVLSAAEENGIPVMPVSEILPVGTSYAQWMQNNLDAIATALGG